MTDNYFDSNEEDVVHDVFLMILSDDTDYENIEDVLLGETTFTQRTIDYWSEEYE